MSDNVEYTLFLDDDGSCRLDIYFRGMNSPAISGWHNLQSLLSAFLNEKYIPQVFDYDNARSLLLLSNCPFSKDKCREILASWDKESVDKLIKDIYEEEDEFVKKLNPYERYFVRLSFTGEPLFIEYKKPIDGPIRQALINEPKIEMPRADRFHITDVAKAHGVDFYSLYHKLMEERNISKEKALYIAGCMIAANYKVKSDISAVYSFFSTESLVNWLLLNTIKNNKYVHRCKYCNRYFGASRNDKMTCGTYCTNQYEKYFGRYDDPEITRLTKCINSALDERIKNQAAGVKYVVKKDSDFTEVNFKEFKASFQKKCRSHTQKLKEHRKRNDLDKFCDEAGEFLKWLEKTHAQVQNFVKDRLV